MNKFFVFIWALLITILIAAAPAVVVAAEGDDPRFADPLIKITDIIEGKDPAKSPGLERFVGRPHELSSTQPGADIITTLVFQILDFAKYLLGGLAIIYILIAGIRLITAGDDVDDVSTKQKNALRFIMYALVLVIIGDTLVQQVFYGHYGECYASPTNAQACAQSGAELIRGLYNFVEVFVASIAVTLIVFAGLQMITSTGEEDILNKQKRHIAVALLGLVVIGVSEFLIKDFIFPPGGQQIFVVDKGRLIIAMITNFIASFVGTIAIAFWIYGGYLYVVGAGQQDTIDEAKKIFIGAAIGLIIAGGSFAIVQSVYRLDADGEAHAVRQLADVPSTTIDT